MYDDLLMLNTICPFSTFTYKKSKYFNNRSRFVKVFYMSVEDKSTYIPRDKARIYVGYIFIEWLGVVDRR